MQNRHRILLAALMITLLTVSRAVWAAPDDAPVQLKPPAAIKLKVGKTASVPLQITIASGYHIFGAQPLVEGIRPTAIEVTAANGLTSPPVKMPAPKKVRIAALQKDANVYEGTVKAILTVQAAATAKPGKQTLAGTLRYQACSDQKCLFPKKVAFTVPVEIVK